MEKLRSVAFGALALSLAQVLNPLTSVLLISAVARTQGAEGLGAYSLVLTIFYMAVGLAGLGLATPITRAVAVDRTRASDFLVATSGLGAVCGVVAILCVSGLVALLGYSPEVRAPADLLMLAVVPSVLLLHYDAILMACRKAHYIAFASIAENVGKVAVSLGLLAAGYGVFSVFVVIVVFRFLVLGAYLVLFQLRVQRISLRFDWSIIVELYKVSSVFALNLLLAVALSRVDVLLISKLGDLASVGYYSAALRIIELVQVLPLNLKRAALPAMCESFYKAPDVCARIFTRCFNYMAVFGFGAGLGLVLLAPTIIFLVFGGDFEPANDVLVVMALSVVPFSLSPALACWLFASNRERLDLASNVARLLVQVVLCVALIPAFSQMGAAVALVVSQVALVAMMAYFLRTALREMRTYRELFVPAVASVVGIVAAIATPRAAPGLDGVVGLVVFAGVVLILDRELRKDLGTSAQSVRALIGKVSRAD